MDVEREVVLDAPPAEVWEALTDRATAGGVVRERRRVRSRPGRRLPLGRRRGPSRGGRGGRRRAAAGHPLVGSGRSGGERGHVHARGDPGRDTARGHRDGVLRLGLGAGGVCRKTASSQRCLTRAVGACSRRSPSRDSASLTELAAELPVTRQAVSKHLAALGDAGLVEAQSRRPGDPVPPDAAAARRSAGVDGADRRPVGRAARAAARASGEGQALARAPSRQAGSGGARPA